MSATLDIRFVGPNAAFYNAETPQLTIRYVEPSAGRLLRNSIASAFDRLLNRFDYTTGRYVLNVDVGSTSIAGSDPSAARISGDTYAQVGASGGAATLMPAFGLDVVGRNGTTPDLPTLTLNLAGPNVSTGGLLREFEHALGVRSARGTAAAPIPAGGRTVYDGNVLGAAPQLSFAGPNTLAFFGKPVPLSPLDASAVTLPGIPQGSANMYAGSGQPANSVQLLDVAMMRDAGLPALTDQEILEHQIARIYFGALGRVATGAELTASTRYFLNAVASLQKANPAADNARTVFGAIGTALVSGSGFANEYGSLSDADYVRTVFQNTYGRAVDGQTLSSITQFLASTGTAGRGAMLFTLTDLLDARGRLSANPNVTYSGTVEAQTARLYDTAFGRAADPGGFTAYAGALINGTSLKQVAMAFLQSAEFTSRYGASPSDQALVDGLYQNTLGRAPDAAGEAQYLRALASGTFDRADLVVAFSESSEHIALMAQRVGAQDAAGLFLNTQTPLGLIPVLSGTTPYLGGAPGG